jgi:predicted alpha/beta-fold hydrolase
MTETVADAFVPHPALTGGHKMTVYGWANPRRFPMLPNPVVRYFDVAVDARVVAACHWQARPWECPTIIALHGLNASSEAHYMQGIAAKAFARGMNVVRLNQRNCGNTEHLSATLFHSGLTADVARVLDELASVDGLSSIAVAGYSLGGNLALKLAGEYGSNPPPFLSTVAAVSPILEIAACVNALERPANALYQWNFVRDLKHRMRRKNRFWPGRFDLSKLAGIRTVRQFDDAYTAPSFGFKDAEDYYFRASAMRVVDRITVPALVITAEDDPFVPAEPFRDPKVTDNPHIALRLCRHGGHCGFVGPRNGAHDDGYWAEGQIVDFVERWSRQGLPAAGHATPQSPWSEPLPADRSSGVRTRVPSRAPRA